MGVIWVYHGNIMGLFSVYAGCISGCILGMCWVDNVYNGCFQSVFLVYYRCMLGVLWVYCGFIMGACWVHNGCIMG